MSRETNTNRSLKSIAVGVVRQNRQQCGLQIPQVLDAIQLSHATFNKIRQNLWWAFGYNLVGIPLAAGALLPSMGIALTPSLSGQPCCCPSHVLQMSCAFISVLPHACTYNCMLLFRPIMQPSTLSMPDIMFEFSLVPCSGYCPAPLRPSTAIANSLQESVLLGTCSRMNSHKTR